ncbi:response regulator [Paraburkholderia megapolitana]|uniref:response regulator n=1 Tax=Paraburkholderia megapolitana TaxID=420953 RepID=UPI0038BA8CE0
MACSTELLNRRILVVEDDFLVAQALCALLENAGATSVGPIGWLDEALAFVETQAAAVDGAVLDVDLHGEKSYAVADALARHDIHFVFVTGYGSESLDPVYHDVSRCEKPFDPRTLFLLLANR